MTMEQEGYRFRRDDGSEAYASWLDDQDVPQLMSLRATVNEPGGGGTSAPRKTGPVNFSTIGQLYVAHVRPWAVRTECIISRFDTAPQRSCYFMLRDDGAVLFGWSTNGTDVTDVPSTVQWFDPAHSWPIRLGQSFWVGVHHNPLVDPRQTKFYVGPNRESLLSYQLGATVSFGTTGVVYDSTAPWNINVRVDGGFHFNGDIYSVEAFEGADLNATRFLNPTFHDRTQGWQVGETSPSTGTDAHGNVWTLDADHAIMGGVRRTVPFRVRILGNAVGDPATQQGTLVYKRVDEPDSEWRAV